jgi:CheY-like chemotaxis protein/DNA-binding XRE family transcriptional regulator
MTIKINEKIKSIRKHSGLSQEAFAQKLGVSFTTVNRWENGHAVPNQLARKNIDNICHELGYDCEDDQIQESFRILIVDDEPKVVNILRKSISKLDFDTSIETAEDGYEAGLKVSTFRPYLVILDIFMPGIRGDVVCQKIKQDPITSNTFIVAISGKIDEQLRTKLTDFGADVVLEKPIDHEQIIHIISQQRKTIKI